MTPTARSLVALTTLLSACGTQPVTLGLTEPISVESAQFVAGTLPGAAPLTDEQQIAGEKPVPPNVTSYDLSNQLILPGEPAKSVRGRTSPDAFAVGARIDGEGSGYWLLPTGIADLMNGGELGWSFRAAFNPELTPGLKRLLLAAIAEGGQSGTQTAVKICIGSQIPDNDNVCDPKRQPPDLVVSLAWDAPADLDLRVITPEGKVVDAKHPSTALADEDDKVDPTIAGTGIIDHDSNRDCLVDGLQRENLVFSTLPTSGNYLVYANLYDACAEDSVNFGVTFHVSVAGAEPDTFAVTQSFRQAGSLQAVHANGGKGLGMYVGNFIIP